MKDEAASCFVVHIRTYVAGASLPEAAEVKSDGCLVGNTTGCTKREGRYSQTVGGGWPKLPTTEYNKYPKTSNFYWKFQKQSFGNFKKFCAKFWTSYARNFWLSISSTMTLAVVMLLFVRWRNCDVIRCIHQPQARVSHHIPRSRVWAKPLRMRHRKSDQSCVEQRRHWLKSSRKLVIAPAYSDRAGSFFQHQHHRSLQLTNYILSYMYTGRLHFLRATAVPAGTAESAY